MTRVPQAHLCADDDAERAATQRLLAEHAERFREMEARLAALERAAHRPRPDALADERLLAALAGVFGQQVFDVADVRLAAVHDTILGAIVQDVTARRLGAILRRLAQTAGGAEYTLQRVGRAASGVLWCMSSRQTYTP